jgi:glycosyltransferase involved in cell wall biosynthesis
MDVFLRDGAGGNIACEPFGRSWRENLTSIQEKRPHMKVAFNLLAAIAGSQVSRALAFVERFASHPSAHLIVLKEQETMSDLTSTANRTVIDVPLGLGRFRALRRMRWENFELAKLVRSQGADVFLTFSHYLPSIRELDIPTVVGVSNLAPFSAEALAHESLGMKIKLKLLRQTILSSTHRSSRVLALSDTCREVLIAEGVPKEKIAVTPNGVDTYWERRTSSTGVLDSSGITRPYLLYVSHFYRYKNHARLLSAYSRLPDTMRAQHQLVFVGRPFDRAYYEELRLQIGHLGLTADVVLIPGEQGDRLRELYQSCKVFVFASLIENSPAILLEAMMAGSPVLTSSFKPMPEFGGDAVEYFDPVDTTAIEASLRGLLTDAPRLLMLSKLSRAQARRFTWDTFFAGVMEQIETAAL